MKNFRWLAKFVFILALLFYFVPSVGAVPGQPEPFHGIAYLNGTPVSTGTVISAWIGGFNCGTFTTLDSTGGFLVIVRARDTSTPGSENCGVDGDTIVFHVGDLVASPTAIFASGHETVTLNLYVFTPPSAFSKSSPVNTAANIAINTTLSWVASSNATSYKYCYATTNGCTPSTSTTSTSSATLSLNNNTTYYWQVQAINDAGATSANSTTYWSFTTIVAPPSAFSKSSPANDAAAVAANTALSWAASSNAASYKYCISTTINCTPSIQTSSTSSGSLSLNYSTTYYWQVQAINAADTIPANSGAYWSFTTAEQNVAPVITEGSSIAVTMDEDGSPTAFSLSLHATDANVSNTLTWSISTSASHGTATASGTGTSKLIRYTPTANYNGTDSFVVKVSDGSLTDTITVNVTITARNDAPVITEGTTTTVSMNVNGTPTPFALTLHATDIDSGTLTWSISTAALHGAANASGTGSSKAISYSPNTDYEGTDSFVVQVSDGSLADKITVNVTIILPNIAPVITEGASIDEVMDEDGTPTAFSLTLHATDANVSDTLTWSISAKASHGTATASGTGASKVINYAPASNYNGTDSFVVRVSDGSLIDTITVNVKTTPQNDAPVITEGNSITVTMSENGTPTKFSLTLHATDIDSTTLTWTVSKTPSHGTASVSGTGDSKVILYTPGINYHGNDSFTILVSDGSLTDTITVNVALLPIPTIYLPLVKR